MEVNSSNYMAMAFAQALQSVGISRPNPAVGAVVVKDGIVVGMGRTQSPGNAHAEVMALGAAGELARGAAIFVTLEPCCHYGRTPPCTKAIIEAGISKVFFAHADPNPLVRGKSTKLLEEAGIEVREGLEACNEAEFDELQEISCGDCLCLHSGAGLLHSSDGQSVFRRIERFYEAYDYFVRHKRTFVELKSALTSEGAVASVDEAGICRPVSITGEGANCWNHELRAMSDALLVSSRTLVADNPAMNVRLAEGNSPIKIVLGFRHVFSAEEVSALKFFNSLERECGCRAILFSGVPQPNLQRLAQDGWLEIVPLPSENFKDNWEFVIENLSARGMHRLMVEPGATLARLIFESSLWNRLNLWRSIDHRIDDQLQAPLDYPELPPNVVAGESAVVMSDVLTVYYPN